MHRILYQVGKPQVLEVDLVLQSPNPASWVPQTHTPPHDTVCPYSALPYLGMPTICLGRSLVIPTSSTIASVTLLAYGGERGLNRTVRIVPVDREPRTPGSRRSPLQALHPPRIQSNANCVWADTRGSGEGHLPLPALPRYQCLERAYYGELPSLCNPPLLPAPQLHWVLDVSTSSGTLLTCF